MSDTVFDTKGWLVAQQTALREFEAAGPSAAADDRMSLEQLVNEIKLTRRRLAVMNAMLERRDPVLFAKLSLQNE
jgi:hypothetical protein